MIWENSPRLIWLILTEHKLIHHYTACHRLPQILTQICFVLKSTSYCELMKASCPLGPSWYTPWNRNLNWIRWSVTHLWKGHTLALYPSNLQPPFLTTPSFPGPFRPQQHLHINYPQVPAAPSTTESHIIFFTSRLEEMATLLFQKLSVRVELCVCIHSCVSMCVKDGSSLSHSEVANRFRTGTDLQIWPSNAGVLTSLRKVQCLAAKSLFHSEYLLTVHWDVFWKMLL